MFAVDLHAHTRFFHGFRGRVTPYDPLGARLLAGVARWRSLDGVALTNHDYFRRFRVGGGGVQLIPGIEISTTAGHLLVVGPDPPAHTPPNVLTPEEVVSLAHERGCAAIIAHPFRNSTVRDMEVPADAVEINGKHLTDTERVRDLARSRGLPIVGGSDAHFPFEIGRVYTLVQADELTPDSIVAAIQDGRVEPHIAESVPFRLLRRAYRHIHRYRGHVTE